MLRLLDELDNGSSAPTAQQQEVLARWSSWGALPQVFDESEARWDRERRLLKATLNDVEYRAARRTTINAHYTDPTIVTAMWAALAQIGFDGGSVLEPGAGVGTFIGNAPMNVAATGVELDPVSAKIAGYLYPEAKILCESFADTRLPAGSFDAAIGNVPFGDVSLHDPIDNRGGHAIHNHFIIKSLRAVRPGGVAAFVTTHHTLDALNPAARREMNQLADLVGAVRLPTGAHRRMAGTEALTDIVMFRRREESEPAADQTWESVRPIDVDGHLIRVNNALLDRPDRILGDLSVGTGMYGSSTVHVRGNLDELGARLGTVLQKAVEESMQRGIIYRPATNPPAPSAVLAGDAQQLEAWDGTIVRTAAGGFATVDSGGLEPLAVPKTHRREIGALLELRDAAKQLLAAEANQVEDSTDLEQLRSRARGAYESYTARYGPLNRFTLRPTGREDPQTGEPRTARITPPALRAFRVDPLAPLVKALEVFDEASGAATPAGLLRGRVVEPRHVPRGAETIEDAVSISLDQTGRLETDLIRGLLGVDEAEAATLLEQVSFTDPVTGALVHSPEYLSGDIHPKLQAAETAAAEDPTFARNVSALQRVVPAPVPLEDITARLGAVWISEQIHQQFLAELLDDDTIVVEQALPGQWNVKGRSWGVKASSDWGTDRRPAPDLAAAAMSQRQIAVYDHDSDGTRTFNAVATTAAQEKADALQEEFGDWVWRDPARAHELSAEYNRRFNSIVLRDYTEMGERLALPGLVSSFEPRPHQRAAVARILSEPAVGLFHEVGAGKTAEMVIGAMELKRIGMATKPAVVVPNHMLEQFSREWLQLYPQARLLAANTGDLAKDNRRQFVARVATNDWDAIVMTQSAFERLEVSPTVRAEYISRQAEDLRQSLDEARSAGRMDTTIKQIEKAALRAEESAKELLHKPTDPGVTFEETGIDYLFIDEMHMYKNLQTASNIPGAAITGSKKASDLDLKLSLLRERHGDRVITAATATPLANSITEAYVMQKYLRPDILASAGVGSFDAWAATFGETVSEIEMGPAGDFRMKARFSRFQNVPEMMRMWAAFADVKTQADLNLPVPLISTRPDGLRAHETIVVPPTPELSEYIAEIADRADKVAARGVDPSIDNMLKISADGRAAALDLNLVRPDAPATGPVKLDVVAEQILHTWHDTREQSFIDRTTGEPSNIAGGLQLVFSDLGTPSSDRWSAYQALKDRLVAGGMDPQRIRFIHETRNDAEKARMFAAARAGHLDVLIGSTSKMGVGTNVQDRVVAMHHVDCPWRPADIEQRDGRGIRQGNQNPEVAIKRYVVEGSFDAYMWQAQARKAQFINQVMSGRGLTREIEDIGDAALSATEAKALASGNPLLLEKAQADADLQKLVRSEVAHRRAQGALRHEKDIAAQRLEMLEHDVSALERALEVSTPTGGERFQMIVNGQRFNARTDAADAIRAWAHEQQIDSMLVPPDRHARPAHLLGEIGGHQIEVRFERPPLGSRDTVGIRVGLRDVPRSESHTRVGSFTESPQGLVTVLENKNVKIGRSLEAARTEQQACERTLGMAEDRLGAPFPRRAELERARERVAAISRTLHEQNDANDHRQHRDVPDTPPATARPGSSARHEAGRLATMPLERSRSQRSR